MTARTSRWSTVTAAPVLAALAVLAGCDTAPTKPAASTAAPVETRSMTAAAPAAAATPAAPAAAPQSNVATVDLAKTGAAGAAGAGTAPMALPSQRVVYFDFDSFVIKDEYKGVVDGYARVLSANKGKKIVVEGHTDERGGSEYNLALGQKRAAAVAKNLALLGAAESQVEAVSFGKERPVATGHDEDAWAKNRRAELKDR